MTTDIIRRFGVTLLLLVTIAIASSPPKAADAAPPAPPYTSSWYFTNVNLTTAYNRGCTTGTADKNLPGTQYSMAILFFGKPWQSGSTYGTQLLAGYSNL